MRKRDSYRVLVEKPKGRNHQVDPGVNGRILLKSMFKKWVEEHGLDRSGSAQGQVAGSCECGNESSDYIKCETFPD
jgi:hypothetical protein